MVSTLRFIPNTLPQQTFASSIRFSALNQRHYLVQQLTRIFTERRSANNHSRKALALALDDR